MATLAELKDRVAEALEAYRRCREQEELEYGEEYIEVTEMEDEGPAPDPCARAFEVLLDAVRAYEDAGGQRADLDLGAYREEVDRALG